MVNVVGLGEPFSVTVESGTKLDPVSPRVVEGLPAKMAAGASDAITGTGFLTVRGTELELPPPGGGFTTAISNAPAVATSVEGRAAWRRVEPRKLVDRMLPFTVTVDSETKFCPDTSTVNEALPVETAEGEIEVICGTLLETDSIVNVRVVVVPPPGGDVSTTTVAVPAFWMSPAGTSAVSSLVVTKSVVRSCPFHRTSEAGVKLLPSTAIEKAGCPAAISDGTSFEMLGVGELICC